MRAAGGYALCLCLAALSAIPGCGGRYEDAVVTMASGPEESSQAEKPVEVTAASEPETESQEYIPEERIAVDGRIQSYLTGEMTAVEKGDRRPLAVMISNDKESWPHYGMGHAGVIYEVPVEGDMVRQRPPVFHGQ